MSQNCKITNISPGVSLISVLNNFKNFIQITKNNDNIKETKLDKNLNCILFTLDSLDNFSDVYKINILVDLSLNYALFGAGAPGDEQSAKSTLIHGKTQTISKSTINDWRNDTRFYDVKLNIGFGGSNGALAYGYLPCKINDTITILNSNNTSLQLNYNNKYINVGNGQKTILNSGFIKGTGGLTTYSNNWNYDKNYINGTNKLISYSDDIKRKNSINLNIGSFGPNNIEIFKTKLGNTSSFITPFGSFYTYGGNTSEWIGPPSDCEVLKNIPGLNGSDNFALLYYFFENTIYSLTNNDNKLYVDTSLYDITINLLYNNFSDGYTCEIINTGNPINSIIVVSDTQNIVYNYNTKLIQTQEIVQRNIKLIFLNSTWICITL